MPTRETVRKARQLKQQGKAPTTQAGAFVREEIHHVREGKHGAESPQQAIAIGLSKARRAGVALPPPSAERTSAKTRRKARRDTARGRRGARPTSSRRSGTVRGALKRKPRGSASRAALARQGRSAARRRRPADRRRAARQAARTRRARAAG